MQHFIRQQNTLSDNKTLYRRMQHFAGEGWLGLEKLHQLTKKGMYRLKVLLHEFFDTNYKHFLIELNKMLKVVLTDRNWNDYVGYWNWIKVFYIKIEQNPCSCHCIWAGWSRERLPAHLGAVPQDVLHPWGLPQSGPLRRGTQTSQFQFLSQVGEKVF